MTRRGRPVGTTPPKRNPRVIQDYKARAGDSCEACGWRPKPALRDVAGKGKIDRLLAAHHIHPIACGGPDTEDNLVQLCLNCHGIAHVMGQMVAPGSDAFKGAASLRQWEEALRAAEGGPRVWVGPHTRKELFFAMLMLSNRTEYIRLAAMQHRREQYLRIVEEEAYEQDAIETIRLTRAFTVESKPREVYGRRRA